jgi:pimeloyl-ACP methyl ester carboxylesterase
MDRLSIWSTAIRDVEERKRRETGLAADRVSGHARSIEGVIVRTLTRILGGIAALLVLMSGLLFWSARVSLDEEYLHTARTEALPVLSAEHSNGEVRIPARGMEFRARVAGLSGSGPALIALHGFPETSIMWQPLIEAAAASGFRVVAFDQRGYSPGARPNEAGAYRLAELTADLFAVADAARFERFHLVGHDWGSIVGWAAAAQHEDRVASYASLSIPHPGAVSAANAASGRPAYVRFFRMSGVAETIFTAGGLFVMQRAVYNAMSAEHLAEYLAVFAEPGALRSAFDWYRSLEVQTLATVGNVRQPVLYVFGNRDMPVFVRPAVLELQTDFVTGPFQQIELDAGHWLIQERPTEVVNALMSHLRAQAD